MKPRMTLEPSLDTRVLVRGVIVHNQMEILICWCLRIDLLEEPDKLLVPVARHTIANDLAVEHAQSRKQSRCAVALVVVSLSCWNSRSEGKKRLRALQCLYFVITDLIPVQLQRDKRESMAPVYQVHPFYSQSITISPFHFS